MTINHPFDEHTTWEYFLVINHNDCLSFISNGLEMMFELIGYSEFPY